MKGDNELRLNTATMIMAVQEYLNARWASTTEPCPVVKDVKANTNSYETAFVVSLKSEASK